MTQGISDRFWQADLKKKSNTNTGFTKEVG